MKKILLLTTLTLMAMSACQKVDVDALEDSQSGITLHLTVPESSVVQTRVQTAAESRINNLWVFVFDSYGKLVEKTKATNIQSDAHTAKAKLSTGSNLDIYVCANISTVEEAKFTAFVVGTTGVADLKAITTSSSLIGSGSGVPMAGTLLGQTINYATTNLNINLMRSCARLDVVASAPNFTVTGIEMVVNAPTQAPIFSAPTPAPATGVQNYTPSGAPLSTFIYENGITAPDEAAAESKAVAVIVKGVYMNYDGYYKLRIKYGTSPVKYDIRRNVIYAINITKVQAPGFATIAEAAANLPQNVDYTVIVTDSDAHDITTSNGQYYLGVSNSDYVLHASDAQTGLTIVTLTHNAPTTMTSGSITATAGITLYNSVISTSTQKQEVKADLAAGFTSGTLTLRLGNLIKVINLKRGAEVSISGGVVSSYSGAEYVVGEIGDEIVAWLKLGKNISTPETTPKVLNLSGGIWLHVEANSGPAATVRIGSAYVGSSGSRGRTKVDIVQKGNVALDYTNKPANCYASYPAATGYYDIVFNALKKPRAYYAVYEVAPINPAGTSGINPAPVVTDALLTGDMTYVPGDVLEVQWQTAINHAVAAGVNDMTIKSVSLTSDGVAQVKVNGPGNAVIAYKRGITILWSYHIWVTQSNPFVTFYNTGGNVNGTSSSGQAKFMDRNLGALAATSSQPSTVDAYKYFGVLYQHGRATPFTGLAAELVGYTPIYNMNAIGITAGAIGGYVSSLLNVASVTAAIQTPNTFYAYSDWSWYGFDDISLWSTYGVNKSIYDPCPYGYRVPNDGSWTVFPVTPWSAGAVNGGAVWNGAWWPAGGARLGSKNGRFTDSGTIGLYWASTHASQPLTAHGMGLAYSGSASPLGQYSLSNGMSVRCVQEGY